MRGLAVVAALVVAAGAAAAQTSPNQSAPGQTAPSQTAPSQKAPSQTAPSQAVTAGNPSLRAIPDGPGVPVAELQGLDKVTARTKRFYAPVGQTTTFGTLAITVGDCLVNTPDAPLDSVAYLTIVDHKPGQAEQKLFAGWMFASTPSISALDDGVYDVRVLACTREQASSPPKSR